MSRISVAGLGKLGACMAACFAAKGHEVIGIDTSAQVVGLVNRGRPPVYEPGLLSLMQICSERLKATADFAEAVRDSEVTFIVVPTPSTDDGGFSMEAANRAARDLGRAIKEKGEYHLVVLTSTVLPGSTEQSLIPILEAESGRRCGPGFGVCYNPEFIALGTVIRDFLNPDLVLIGESDQRAGDHLEACLAATLDRRAEVARMSISNAELTKIAINTYVTTKIAFANMISDVCDRLPGGDVDAVTRAIGMDSRIGPRYLKGGMPFGGPCFPRDNRALSSFVNQLELRTTLPDAVDRANEEHLAGIISRIRALPQQGQVAILGLSYKPGSAVLEASPGFDVAVELKRLGRQVSVYDKLVSEMEPEALPRDVPVTADLAKAVGNADVIVVANPDPDLVTPEALQVLASSPARIVFDCWRLLEKHLAALAGKQYLALGKPAAARNTPATN